MLALLFFISALLIPKLDNYIELLKNPTIYNKLSAPLIEYTEKMVGVYQRMEVNAGLILNASSQIRKSCFLKIHFLKLFQ